MERKEISAFDIGNHVEVQLLIDVDEAETSENITIHLSLLDQEIFSSHYQYLNAYQEFRDRLLDLGYGLKCNGSRINAVQSPMMSCTDKVYLVELGQKALMKDIVHIFDYAYIDEFCTTQQQNEFFDEWMKSLNGG